MKHLIFILIIGTVLTGCSNVKNEEEATTTNELTTNSEQLKEFFRPYLKGAWTLSAYINDLKETKSPFKSYDKLNDITEIVFSQLILSDTLFVNAGINNHEGYNFNIIFIEGQSDYSLRTDIPDYIFKNKGGFCDIEFQISNNDTVLNLCIYNSEKSLLKKISFQKIRAEQPKNDFAYGLEYFANDLLFAGTYTLFDTNQTAKNIEFKANGKVFGFKEYKNYSVMTDFGVLIENNLDNVLFYKGDRDYDTYLYEICKDTINLYQPILDTVEYKYGNLIYKMVKQK